MASLLEAVRGRQAVLTASAEPLGRLSSVEEQCRLAWHLAGQEDLRSEHAQKSGSESEQWRGKGNAFFQVGCAGCSLIYFFRFPSEKNPLFSLSFAFSEYERRTLLPGGKI
jgi:hypothetical protein